MSKKMFGCMLIVVFIVSIIAVALFFNRTPKTQTIEEILNINLDDIDYIQINGENEYPVDEFKNIYRNIKLKKVNMEHGNSAQIYFEAYDKNKELIFTLIDIGNNNLIYLKTGTFDTGKDKKYLYQFES